jgi:transcriptional regulator with XRE-family HTH domain
MAGDAERPRLRELRTEVGWTQQQLADGIAQLAWTHGHGHIAVNADMVAKWERGVKGASPRYRALLCQLFGVTADQLGFSPTVSATPTRPVRDAESLVSMLDDAASLLDQLGAAGTALAPQMLAAWKDTVTSRRTMLGLLDLAATDPAGHARAATATITDLEQLAQRYQALHATADPTALLTPVAAHVRMASAALSQDHTADERRRLLRNRATLAGRLASEDLGDAASGRAYFSLALDSARQTGDDQTGATILGYTAQLTHAEGMTTAALHHLTAALDHATTAPAVAGWLASIQAIVHADSGDHTAAIDALHRAEPVAHQQTKQSSLLVDYGPAHLAAATGRVYLQTGHDTTAQTSLTAALDQLPPTARRARVLALTDLAMVELRAGKPSDACLHATTAAELLHRTPYATGAARLRAFRSMAARPLGPRALRALDDQIGGIAA